jgi:hypothetical protein
MFRTTEISTLVVAGILGATGLAAPAASHAQTPDGERALLNPIPASVEARAARALAVATDDGISLEPVDGERALIVRVASAPVAIGGLSLQIVPGLPQGPVTGDRALLGR